MKNSMKHVVGILGGLGPQTTAHFYVDLVRRATQKARPDACIWSLPLNLRREAEFIASGAHRLYLRRSLADGMLRLERAGSDFIVIPCNTVHEFHAELARRAEVPVVNLIDIVADEIVRRGWNRVMLLATSRTVATRLYHKSLGARGVQVDLPSDEDQRLLDQLIMGILGNSADDKHQQFLAELIDRAGTNNVILGCTDLQLLCRPTEAVVDSTEVLIQHTTKLLTE